MGSDTERDLVKWLEEDTFLEVLFLADIIHTALATLALSVRSNLMGAGSSVVSLSSLKAQIPVTLFLLPPTLVPLSPLCFRYRIGFSFTSGLKLTLLLAFLDIFDRKTKRKKREKNTKFGSRGGRWVGYEEYL